VYGSTGGTVDEINAEITDLACELDALIDTPAPSTQSVAEILTKSGLCSGHTSRTPATRSLVSRNRLPNGSEDGPMPVQPADSVASGRHRCLSTGVSQLYPNRSVLRVGEVDAL
jgi:hypothetical protein